MEFNNKKILVVGFGKSGFSTARYLMSRGAKVTLGDIKPETDLDKDMLKEVRDSGIHLEIGEHHVGDGHRHPVRVQTLHPRDAVLAVLTIIGLTGQNPRNFRR